MLLKYKLYYLIGVFSIVALVIGSIAVYSQQATPPQIPVSLTTLPAQPVSPAMNLETPSVQAADAQALPTPSVAPMINPVHPVASDPAVEAPLPTPPAAPALNSVYPEGPVPATAVEEPMATPPSPPVILPDDGSDAEPISTPPPVPTMMPAA